MKTESRIKVLAKCYLKSKKYGNDEDSLEPLEEQIQELLDKLEYEDPKRFEHALMELSRMGYY